MNRTVPSDLTTALRLLWVERTLRAHGIPGAIVPASAAEHLTGDDGEALLASARAWLARN